MALLEKGIPFDTVLISLADKPAWFAQVNEAMLTPVARVNGVNIAESDDILMARLRLARCNLVTLASRVNVQRPACDDTSIW